MVLRQDKAHEILMQDEEEIVEEYGELGEEILPKVRTYQKANGLLEDIETHDLGDTYDPNYAIREQITQLCELINDDLARKLDDE